MLRIEYNNNGDQYHFLYVNDEVRISTTEPDSFNLEYRGGTTVQIHNVWSYLNPSKDALFALSLLTQYSNEVLSAIQVIKACGVKDED